MTNFLSYFANRLINKRGPSRYLVVDILKKFTAVDVHVLVTWSAVMYMKMNNNSFYCWKLIFGPPTLKGFGQIPAVVQLMIHSVMWGKLLA